MATTTAPAPDHRTVSFVEAFGLALRNYANFNGRTSRGGYWWYYLWTIIISIVAGILDLIIFPSVVQSLQGSGPIGLLLGLGLLIPGIAIGVRRLHDIGKSGWWWLIALTIIGILLLIYWFCQPGNRSENRFGPDVEAGK
jgi:uncharacterized membrane protein YhaH (DUF805 family)